MTTSLLVTGQMTQMLPGLLGLEDEPGGKDVSEWPPGPQKQVPWILPLKLKVGLMSQLSQGKGACNEAW